MCVTSCYALLYYKLNDSALSTEVYGPYRASDYNLFENY